MTSPELQLKKCAENQIKVNGEKDKLFCVAELRQNCLLLRSTKDFAHKETTPPHPPGTKWSAPSEKQTCANAARNWPESGLSR